MNLISEAKRNDNWSWLPGRKRYYRRQAALKLDKAADLLERSEWDQGSFVNYKGTGFCALGAIQVTCGAEVATDKRSGGKRLTNDALVNPLYYVAAHEMANCIKTTGHRADAGDLNVVTSWNDRRVRTKEEVVAMFRGCARRLRGKSEAKLTPETEEASS